MRNVSTTSEAWAAFWIPKDSLALLVKWVAFIFLIFFFETWNSPHNSEDNKSKRVDFSEAQALNYMPNNLYNKNHMNFFKKLAQGTYEVPWEAPQMFLLE